MRYAILAAAVLLAACATTSLEQRWSEAGHPVPDIWCYDYLNVSVTPKAELYAYTRSPYAGRVLFANGTLQEGILERGTTERTWRWTVMKNGEERPMALRIDNRWQGFLDDDSVIARAQKHGAKMANYRCEIYQ